VFAEGSFVTTITPTVPMFGRKLLKGISEIFPESTVIPSVPYHKKRKWSLKYLNEGKVVLKCFRN
jgi:hypothetical protein